MKTYLITGGCGFIGSNYINKIINDDVFIINLDKLTYASNPSFLKINNKKNYKFILGDITDEKIVEEVFCNYQIDYVINFAAESHVDNSYLSPQTFTKTNVLGVSNLLTIAMKYWKNDLLNHRFIQISTDEVYGGNPNMIYSENSCLNPSSPYSSSKASADLIVLSFVKSFNFPAIITRSSNNFGPNQFEEKLIPKFFKLALNNKPLTLYGNGMHLRDWLFVEDNINAINFVLQKGEIGQIYNICAKNEKTNLEITKLILDYIKKNINENINENLITFVDDRPTPDFRYNLNCDKLINLGFNPSLEFEENFNRTLEFYKNKFMN